MNGKKYAALLVTGVMALALAGCSNPEEPVDAAAPVPGGSGVISTMNVGSDYSFIWDAATDDVSAQGELEYRVYRKQNVTYSAQTPEAVMAEGTAMTDWIAGATSYDWPYIPVDTYWYYNVVVRDKSGKTACYVTFQLYIVG